MSKATLIGTVLLIALGTVFVACSRGESDKPIKAPWVEAKVVDENVYLPLSEVEKNTIAQFKVGTGTEAGDIAFLSYKLDKEIYVRADICVPCRSEEFSLQKNILVCDTCGTVFDARTGEGIRGACVAFPKAASPYEVTNGNIVMKGGDLIKAYIETLKPGLP